MTVNERGRASGYEVSDAGPPWRSYSCGSFLRAMRPSTKASGMLLGLLMGGER